MSRFKKIIKKKELETAMAKHPLREIDEQVKKDYVKGLVFVAVEDGNFSEEEKDYVVSLIKNIGLEESFLQECETFASDASEDEIIAFMDSLKSFEEDIKVNFLIEVVVISFKDGEFDETEQEMFNDYLDMLELTDKKDDIMYISLALVNKDIDLALSLYTAKKEFFEKYDYMFDMIDVDIEKELKDVYNWEWVEFRLEEGKVENDNLVASKPVTVQQFCIYLNSVLISEDLKQVVNTTQFEQDDKVIIKDIEKVNIDFVDGMFVYDNNIKNNCILGIKYTNCFCNFVSEKLNTKIELLNILAGGVYTMECNVGSLMPDFKILAFAQKIGLDSSSEKLLTTFKEIFVAGIMSRDIVENKMRYLKTGTNDYDVSNKNGDDFIFRVMKVEGE